MIPESPRWLVKNGQPDKAGAVMARIGGGEYAEREVHSIQATLIGEIERVNFGDLLQPKMFGIVLVGLFLAMLQQWCGINVIFYYAADIFRNAGYTVDDALLSIVIIGGVNLVFTVIAVNCVDRLGRRILMLLGFSGLAIMHLLMGACFCFEKGGNLVLGLTLAEIGCYALTLAPVTWVVLSEIFPNRIRGAAMSISVFALWAACFLLTDTFPYLKEFLGQANTFWIYGAICACGWVFVFLKLPETKGKSLEELEKQLVG